VLDWDCSLIAQARLISKDYQLNGFFCTWPGCYAVLEDAAPASKTHRNYLEMLMWVCPDVNFLRKTVHLGDARGVIDALETTLQKEAEGPKASATAKYLSPMDH